MNSIPYRTLDSMSEAIALSSPSGSMSLRARQAATKRLRISLFGENGLQLGKPSQPEPMERARILRQQAADLRHMAAQGMKPRTFIKQAAQLEKEADTISAK